MLEAMAVGAVVVGSRTAPVCEVIEDGGNGYLVDFFSHQELADKVCQACLTSGQLNPLRQAAMETIARHFNLRRDCLNQQLALLFPTLGASSRCRALA
jgi:glycosyltransferase involved in cell wall biosynthesis